MLESAEPSTSPVTLKEGVPYTAYRGGKESTYSDQRILRCRKLGSCTEALLRGRRRRPSQRCRVLRQNTWKLCSGPVFGSWKEEEAREFAGSLVLQDSGSGGNMQLVCAVHDNNGGKENCAASRGR